MTKRIISSAVAIAVLVLVLFSPVYIIGICCAALSALALYEAFSAFAFLKKPAFLGLGFIACVAFPFLEKLNTNYISSVVFIYIFIICILMIFHNKKISFIDISVLAFLVLLIPFAFSHLVYIRQFTEYGMFYIWLPFIGAFCCDTGAFFVGRYFGGRKLCEELSPKKTVSGCIGGFIGSILGFLIYSLVLGFFFNKNVYIIPYYILSLICGVAAQTGDLTASAVKRHSHIKDFGNIMPGHGGILDRVDSLMFTAPAVYIYICTFGIGIF